MAKIHLVLLIATVLLTSRANGKTKFIHFSIIIQIANLFISFSGLKCYFCTSSTSIYNEDCQNGTLALRSGQCPFGYDFCVARYTENTDGKLRYVLILQFKERYMKLTKRAFLSQFEIWKVPATYCEIVVSALSCRRWTRHRQSDIKLSAVLICAIAVISAHLHLLPQRVFPILLTHVARRQDYNMQFLCALGLLDLPFTFWVAWFCWWTPFPMSFKIFNHPLFLKFEFVFSSLVKSMP